ncbi:hypothetical protein [Acidovorax sp. sic0104]|uniref:hypothetical protein n=1 Tax=Acidovorax sp. sic0104 TaxID=2854784 RepID=UPI001C47FAFA|nr:hypothetical protein [Acidovorax sp. sic0104]MBV7542079.1 hypothetical protein [Acidovorax sp. sic0104]
MGLIEYKWDLEGDWFWFRGRAEAPLSANPAIEAELLDVAAWLQERKISRGRIAFSAKREQRTSKSEALVVNRGKVEADGSTVFHPVVTTVEIRLPQHVAAEFRFAFNVVDDR